MTKAFLDVFPNLNITDELRELLNLVEVEKVTSTRDRSSIRVYIVSPRLIHKQNIYGLEKGIKDQLFPSKQVSIKIIEKFRLSGQYTPEKLLAVYRDSILMELKNYSIIEYNIFRKTEYEFPEPDLLKMTVEDTIVTHEKEAELKRVLEKIFFERCGLPIEVRYEYVEPKENALAKQKELQMQREVEEIVSRTSLAAVLNEEQALPKTGTEDGYGGPSMADAASLEALAAGYSAEVPFDEGPARQGAADNGCLLYTSPSPRD